MKKNDDSEEIRENNELIELEYVNLNVIRLLFGYSEKSFRNNEFPSLDKIRFMVNGRGRKFHFGDAARLIYPSLTDFEVASLRIDINSRLLGKGKNYELI